MNPSFLSYLQYRTDALVPELFCGENNVAKSVLGETGAVDVQNLTS